MNNYLDSYQNILPPQQAQRLTAFMELVTANGTSTSQAEALITQLAATKTKLTTYKAAIAGDFMDSDAFNDFYTNVYYDLLWLFKEALILEEATTTYDLMFESEVDLMVKELKALQARIQAIKVAASSPSYTQTILETFDNSSNFDTTIALVDRDGTVLAPAQLTVFKDDSSLALSHTVASDALRDANGNVVATASLDGYIGNPTSQSSHTVAHAIDKDLTTYWAEFILTDTPLVSDLNDNKLDKFKGSL